MGAPTGSSKRRRAAPAGSPRGGGCRKDEGRRNGQGFDLLAQLAAFALANDVPLTDPKITNDLPPILHRCCSRNARQAVQIPQGVIRWSDSHLH